MIYAYIRVSTDKQEVENQRYVINEYCKRLNYKVDKWYEDVISGTTKIDKRFSGFTLEILKKGDTLLIAEMTRLGRSMFDLIDALKDATERKYTIISVQDNFKTTDDQAPIYVALGGWFAQMQVKYIRRKTSEGLQRKKSDLLAYTGRVPYGFEQENGRLVKDKTGEVRLVKKENEVALVKRIFDLKNEGVKSPTIANVLNREKFKPRKGTKFYQSSVESIFNNEGFYKDKGVI
jgi:DNA invertase Pin-like site-specific DNA recombinase